MDKNWSNWLGSILFNVRFYSITFQMPLAHQMNVYMRQADSLGFVFVSVCICARRNFRIIDFGCFFNSIYVAIFPMRLLIKFTGISSEPFPYLPIYILSIVLLEQFYEIKIY